MKLSSHYRIMVIPIASSLLPIGLLPSARVLWPWEYQFWVNVDPLRQRLWWRPRR
jgi:hypothetical protein